MKIEAYRCDKCGIVCKEDVMMGVQPIEDLFDKIESYPIETELHKTNIHHCMSCYYNEVTARANDVDRKKDMRAYSLKIKELYYCLKQTCVLNVMNRKKF